MSALSSTRDRIIALMEGSVSGLDRSIPSGRFEHEEATDETAPETESAPYPFRIVRGNYLPLDVPSTMQGSHRYGAAALLVQIFYLYNPNGIEALEQTIEDDALTIWKCLGYDVNWYAIDGVSVVWGGARVADAKLPTAQAQVPPQRHRMLEIELRVTYREDHTS